MERWPAGLVVAALAGAFGLVPLPAVAQAFTPPRGLGAITLAWQHVENTGHRLSDGFLLPRGQSVTSSGALDVEYGVTDRLAATVSIPYVFAKYKGDLPPPSGLPVDACRCWHSGFQDFSFAARYRLGGDAWAVTPLLRLGIPSHGYEYRGEAVVGKHLKEAQLGVSAGAKLPGFLRKASVQATYTYAVVESAVDDVSVDRSTVAADLGYALGKRFYVRAAGTWLTTHGGLRAGSTTGNPFPFPGELNTPERFAERDRLLRVRFVQVGGGLAYSAGPVDVFASFSRYVWGRDAHAGKIFNLGATWYVDRSK